MNNAYEINLMDELTLKGVSQYYAFVQVSLIKLIIFNWNVKSYKPHERFSYLNSKTLSSKFIHRVRKKIGKHNEP